MIRIMQERAQFAFSRVLFHYWVGTIQKLISLVIAVVILLAGKTDY